MTLCQLHQQLQAARRFSTLGHAKISLGCPRSPFIPYIAVLPSLAFPLIFPAPLKPISPLPDDHCLVYAYSQNVKATHLMSLLLGPRSLPPLSSFVSWPSSEQPHTPPSCHSTVQSNKVSMHQVIHPRSCWYLPLLPAQIPALAGLMPAWAPVSVVAWPAFGLAASPGPPFSPLRRAAPS